MGRRVSDSSWTDEQRAEVIEAFFERANTALRGELFEEEDLSDPNDGLQIKIYCIVNSLSGERKYELELTVLSEEEYEHCITQLRPFVLSEQDIFLPKVALHAQRLMKEEYSAYADELIAWIESWVNFDKKFEPLFFETFIQQPDGSFMPETNSAKIADDYIYGKAVKVDLEKRKAIQELGSVERSSLPSALNAYIKQLMRLVLVTRNKIQEWVGCGYMRVTLQLPSVEEVAEQSQ